MKKTIILGVMVLSTLPLKAQTYHIDTLSIAEMAAIIKGVNETCLMKDGVPLVQKIYRQAAEQDKAIKPKPIYEDSSSIKTKGNGPRK